MIFKALAFAFLLTAGDVFATENTCKKWLSSSDLVGAFTGTATEQALKDAVNKQDLKEFLKTICEKKGEDKIIKDFTAVLRTTTDCLNITNLDGFNDLIQTAVNEMCEGTFPTDLATCAVTFPGKCWNTKLFQTIKDEECKDFDTYTKCFVDEFKTCTHCHSKLIAFVEKFKSALTCTKTQTPPAKSDSTSKGTEASTAEKPKSAASVFSIALLTLAAGILQVVIFN